VGHSYDQNAKIVAIQDVRNLGYKPKIGLQEVICSARYQRLFLPQFGVEIGINCQIPIGTNYDQTFNDVDIIKTKYFVINTNLGLAYHF
jgi:hypothetical protein